MAEITFDKFWGWMSPTSLYAKPWECAYIEWIDSTQNVSRIKNLSTWNLNFLTDGNDMQTNFVATGSITSREWFSGEGGQIYIDVAADNIPTKQLTNTNTILDKAFILWGIWLIQKWLGDRVEVSRMDEENASLGWTGSFNEALWISDNDPIDWNQENTYIRSFWESKLIVVKGSKIYELWVIVDWAEAWGYNISELSVRNLWKTCVWLSTTTDFLKLYTKDGRILMYNKAFTLVSETQTGELLHDVVTSNNRDYVIGEEWAYYVEWNNLVPIYKDWNKGLYSITSNFEIFEWRQNVYVLIEINSNKKLLRIWTDNAWFPEALTIMPALDSLGNAVTSIYWVGWRFTLSAWMNVTTTWKWVYTLNGSSTFASGVILTQKFNDWSSVVVKAISEIIVSWKFNDGSTIETIINDDQSSTPIALNNADNKNELIRTAELNGDFLDVALKVVLKWNDELYWIRLKYNGEKQ